MVSIYRCQCGMVFKGSDLSYCPFCGGKLRHTGMVIGDTSLEESLERGWKLIMFRRAKADER